VNILMIYVNIVLGRKKGDFYDSSGIQS